MWRRPVALAVALVTIGLAAWWLVAPQAIGGSMAYLVVRGSSMEPSFGSGDLVVVRAGPPYQPGDVVAYRTPDDRTGGERPGPDVGGGPVIVHRVVRVEGDRLVLRGDANDVDDAIRPTADAVLGRQVVVVPGVGGLVAAIGDRAPVLAVVSAVVLGGSALMASPQRRRTSPAPLVGDGAASDSGGDVGAETPGWSDPLASLGVARAGPPWLWLVLALVVAVGAVGIVRTPASVEEVSAAPWTVRTTFGWDAPPSADAVAAAVYGEDGLRTGETVFVAATPVLVMQVASSVSTTAVDPSLRADGPQGGSTEVSERSSFGAEAAVVSDAGWRRRVAAVEPVALEGGWAAGELAVDLAAAWEAARVTGSLAGRLGEVRLEVVATTTARDGAIEAASVQAFVLDGVTAQPLSPEPDLGTASDGAGAVGLEGLGDTEPIAAVGGDAAGGTAVEQPSGAVAVDGAIETTEVVAAEVSYGPLAVPRSVAVSLVTGAAVVVLVGMVASVVATGRARRRGEASLLVTRHRGSLVPLRSAPASLGGDPVDVTSFAALRRVADTVGQPVGVACTPGGATFWVTDGVRAWRYCTSSR